jgi:hypothetical protein
VILASKSESQSRNLLRALRNALIIILEII